MAALPLPCTLRVAMCALAVFAGVVAHAQPFGEVQTRVVHFADLDLNTHSGVKILYRRIEVSARAVCGEPESPNSPIPSPGWHPCVANAIRSAVIRANRPLLSAYYAERVGHGFASTSAAAGR